MSLHLYFEIALTLLPQPQDLVGLLEQLEPRGRCGTAPEVLGRQGWLG